MNAKKIARISDIIQYISRRRDEIQPKLTISELEAKLGVSQGGISRWKIQTEGPSFEKVLKVLEILNAFFIVKDGNVIKQINSQEELIRLICEKLNAMQISCSKIEQAICISKGMISRWKNRNSKNKIKIGMAIRILEYLKCEVIFIGKEDFDEDERYLEQLTNSENNGCEYVYENYLEQLMQHFSAIESDYFEHLCNFVINNTTQEEKATLIKRLIDEIIK